MTELRPEILFYMRYGVNTNTVKTVLLNKILNPALEVVSDIRDILVKVGESGEAAVLDLPLAVPILDVASAMIMRHLIKGEDPREVMIDWAYMIRDDVNHDPDAHGVCSINHLLERVLISEVRVNLLPVSSPVPMVPTIGVVDDRGYPYSIEAQVFNILKLVLYSQEVTTAVFVKITKFGVTIASLEAICE